MISIVEVQSGENEPAALTLVQNSSLEKCWNKCDQNTVMDHTPMTMSAATHMSTLDVLVPVATCTNHACEVLE